MSEHNQHYRSPDSGQIECECCCSWALDYDRLRKAFQDFIRDRYAYKEMSTAEVQSVIAEWRGR